jgi:hypothetical protein
MIKMKTIILLSMLSACKEPGSAQVSPPPIAEGKCLVDVYIGDQAITQVCVHKGYEWNCTLVGNMCKRGREASGERVWQGPDGGLRRRD